MDTYIHKFIYICINIFNIVKVKWVLIWSTLTFSTILCRNLPVNKGHNNFAKQLKLFKKYVYLDNNGTPANYFFTNLAVKSYL